jgi:hypothetical protein
MPPANPVSRFFRLSAANRWIVLQTLILLPAVKVLLRLVGFRRTLNWLNARPVRAARPPAPEAFPRAWNIARVMRAAARRGLVHGNCLSQSLTLLWLLRRHGLPGDLRLGARAQAGKFMAHAWVEVGGLPLIERRDELSGYAPFERFPASTAVEWR